MGLSRATPAPSSARPKPEKKPVEKAPPKPVRDVDPRVKAQKKEEACRGSTS